MNASPFVVNKWQKHVQQMADVAVESHVPVIAVNQVGANDDLIFDGRSIVMDQSGSVRAVLPGFESCVETIDMFKPRDHRTSDIDFIDRWSESTREIFHAIVLGIRDYCRKTGNMQVLIGLSGGIDSALTAVLAAAAIGPHNVRGVTMPSRYSSKGSVDDSVALARNLGMANCDEASIEAAHRAMHQVLAAFIGTRCENGVTDENIQSRVRGMILMAISNASPGSLVLATSNKSEIATGYSTLYGDMCGGLAVLGDLTKTRIYELSRWINRNFESLGFTCPPIPESSINKPPSAELRPNQTDQDTLPPYEILDQIIERCIEREQSEQTIISETGFDPALVQKIIRMIDCAQYKRDQAPVVLKVTPRAFGRGRPMPIAMKHTAVSNQNSAVREARPVECENAAPRPKPGRVKKLSAER